MCVLCTDIIYLDQSVLSVDTLRLETKSHSNYTPNLSLEANH